MITLDEAIAGQSNLAALCKPSVTNRHERYVPNDNYGFAYVLKKYSGYPMEKAINAVIPHGIYFRDRVLPKSELNASVGAVLTFPPYLSTLWRTSQKQKRVIPFASPIHYALKLFKNEVPVEQRHGSVFLPKHSTALVNIDYNVDKVVRELEEIPNEYKPTTICLHWNDIEKGFADRYRSLGFPVVCAGHLTDYQFIFRWLHLVSRHKVAIGCGLQSALFYSVAAGVPFYLLKENAEIVSSERVAALFNKNTKPYSREAEKRMEKLKSMFRELRPQVSREQQALVDHYTQKPMTMSPGALHRMLGSLDPE